MKSIDSVKNINEILESFRDGNSSIEQASEALKQVLFTDLGHSTVDHQRPYRQGAAEVIYAEGKTPEAVAEIFLTLASRGNNVLATRASPEKFEAVRARLPDVAYREDARMIFLKKAGDAKTQGQGAIAVVSAGTSDHIVAEEAAFTAEFFDHEVLRINDVGVAGINRLFARIDEIRQAAVVIVVAGMDGALPSVVAGLVERPVIAVPTSVGYGASFGGVAALLTMLNSCATGVSVVNIDNGFGAAYMATLINSPVER